MTSQTTQRIGTGTGKKARLLALVLGTLLATQVALGGTAQKADAVFTEKIFFDSNRTTGAGVNNPTGDYEVFKMNPDGTGIKQLTSNEIDDWHPILSPDGTKVLYETYGKQTSNPEADQEIYAMSALDGSGKRNLTNNGADAYDYRPVFSPGGKRIAYTSDGAQQTNPEGDQDIYVMNASDGTGKRNLTNNGLDLDGLYPIYDYNAAFSSDGKRIAYTSGGKQSSNPEGDEEVYRMSSVDGSGKRNLSNNSLDVEDYLPKFSPDGKRIAYESDGVQNSNPQGDEEVYAMSALDGKGKRNLTNNGADADDEFPHFSPGGKRIVYESNGVQYSNPEGDDEVYVMSALDGTNKKNLSNNGADVFDYDPDFSPDGKRFSYTSDGIQQSNPKGDLEIYRMSSMDGTGKKNLTNNDSTDEDSDGGVQAG